MPLDWGSQQATEFWVGKCIPCASEVHEKGKHTTQSPRSLRSHTLLPPEAASTRSCSSPQRAGPQSPWLSPLQKSCEILPQPNGPVQPSLTDQGSRVSSTDYSIFLIPQNLVLTTHTQKKKLSQDELGYGPESLLSSTLNFFSKDSFLCRSCSQTKSPHWI